MTTNCIIYLCKSFLEISYNQPKLNPYISWSANAIPFANNSVIGLYPYSIFIDMNNTIYLADQSNKQILIWSKDSLNPRILRSKHWLALHTLFVTKEGDIYVNNGYKNSHIYKWTINTNNSVLLMNITQPCYGLFIDLNDTLYCSMADYHQVVTKALNSDSNTLQLIAGTGCPGSASDMLYSPRGIFVDINFDLYVADCGNNRVQRFHYSQSHALTIAGNTTTESETLVLKCPTGVILDADKALFIVDSGNHRIIGSGPNGLRCLVG